MSLYISSNIVYTTFRKIIVVSIVTDGIGITNQFEYMTGLFSSTNNAISISNLICSDIISIKVKVDAIEIIIVSNGRSYRFSNCRSCVRSNGSGFFHFSVSHAVIFMAGAKATGQTYEEAFPRTISITDRCLQISVAGVKVKILSDVIAKTSFAHECTLSTNGKIAI